MATRHKHHCATLRESNVARKRRFHETLRGRSRIDFPIRYPFLSVLFQSASWTLLEAVRYDRTRVTTLSWADYPIIHFGDVPQVEVVLINRPEERFLGVGEVSQGPAAAAIPNAIAHATGRRLRALPFSPERVKQALA